MVILDLGNMKIISSEVENVDYIVIQIGDKTYSTSYSEICTGKDIKIARNQLVETKGIGNQNNLWIKGEFTEQKNHQKLPEKLPFQINIYTKSLKSEHNKIESQSKNIPPCSESIGYRNPK